MVVDDGAWEILINDGVCLQSIEERFNLLVSLPYAGWLVGAAACTA